MALIRDPASTKFTSGDYAARMAGVASEALGSGLGGNYG